MSIRWRRHGKRNEPSPGAVAPTGSAERETGRTCPRCGSARWMQRVTVWSVDGDSWQATRSCRSCGEQWACSSLPDDDQTEGT